MLGIQQEEVVIAVDLQVVFEVGREAVMHRSVSFGCPIITIVLADECARGDAAGLLEDAHQFRLGLMHEGIGTGISPTRLNKRMRRGLRRRWFNASIRLPSEAVWCWGQHTLEIKLLAIACSGHSI